MDCARISWVSVVIASASVSLAGCEFTEAELDAFRAAFAVESSSYEGNDGPVQSACFVERFVQPEAEVTKSIDLLFVTDTSGSLDVERGEIADGIDSFIQELPSDVDYQVGVMLGHGSRSIFTGRLWKYGSHPEVLSSRTMSVSQIRSHLKYNLTHVADDRYSDGGEEMLYSLNRAFDHDLMTSSQAKGFFREDAALAVVFITDENDICAVYPEGVEPVRDWEGLEAPARLRDCAGISPESVYSRVKEWQGNRPLLFGAIAYNNPLSVPQGGENEYAYGVLDLIHLSNGVSVDMAGSHYSQGLAEIGSLASVKLQLLTDFTLARGEFDPESLSVRVDGVDRDFIYRSGTNEVHVTDPGVSRSVVEIQYCMKTENPDPTPEPTPEPSPSPSPEPSPSPTSSPCSGPGCGGVIIGV